MTIWCQGSLRADTYRLFKAGDPAYDTWAPWDSRDKASFPLGSAHWDTAGLYRCAYGISGSWSRQSDPLQLVVTGKREELSPPHCGLPGTLSRAVPSLRNVQRTPPLSPPEPRGGLGREGDPPVQPKGHVRHVLPAEGGRSRNTPAHGTEPLSGEVAQPVLPGPRDPHPRGHLQVLRLLQPQWLPVVTAQQPPGAPGHR